MITNGPDIPEDFLRENRSDVLCNDHAQDVRFSWGAFFSAQSFAQIFTMML